MQNRQAWKGGFPIKRALSVFFSLLFLLASGCSNGRYSPDEITAKLISRLSLTGMVEVNAEQLQQNYGISSELVDDFSFFVSGSTSSADAVAAFLPAAGTADAEARLIGILAENSRQVSGALKNSSAIESNKALEYALYDVKGTLVYVVCSNYQTVSDYMARIGGTPITG